MDLNAGWSEYIKENGSHSYIEDYLEDYTLVSSDITDTWRWGECFFDVYKLDDKLIGVSYRQSSGDEVLDPEEMLVRFAPVKAFSPCKCSDCPAVKYVQE